MTSNLRIYTKLTLSIVFLTFLPLGNGQQRPCTEAEGKRALDEADSLRTWDALQESYRSHRACDDGAIAEGYSESVIRILADHWSTLTQLDMLGKRDAEFRRFVIRHVDATLNTDDLVLVKRKATTACPVGLSNLCNDLAKQADSTLKNAASP